MAPTLLGFIFIFAGATDHSGISRDLMFVCANMWFCVSYIQNKKEQKQ